jgi:hypothetical protein
MMLVDKANVFALFALVNLMLSVGTTDAANKKPSFGGSSSSSSSSNNFGDSSSIYNPSKNKNYNKNKNSNTEKETLFYLLENGCELIGVESYSAANSTDSTGCVEEWQYNVKLIDSKYPTMTVVSDSIDLRADTCQDLRGENFDAINMQTLNVSGNNYLVNCFMPKNITFIAETVNCSNDACLSIGDAYGFMASGAVVSSAFSWSMIVTASGIAASIFSLL